MMKGLEETKATIRKYMRNRYTDERLVMLLDHARVGHLCYNSCCCFAGIPTAEHRLISYIDSRHGVLFMDIPDGEDASAAFYALGYVSTWGRRTTDEMRRKRIIPMVLAEIRRRQFSKKEHLNHEGRHIHAL